MRAAAPAATGVERLVPPQVVHASFPFPTLFSVTSPGEKAPSATMSVPTEPFAPGPRLDQTMTSLYTIWRAYLIESQPVPPNCVEAPTLMPLYGDGEVTVPKPGAPFPVEPNIVVRLPSWVALASIERESKPS